MDRFKPAEIFRSRLLQVQRVVLAGILCGGLDVIAVRQGIAGVVNKGLKLFILCGNGFITPIWD